MTILLPSERLGAQEPLVDSRPPAHSIETGLEAIELADSAGIHLYEWQKAAVVAIFSERADGKWSAFETAVMVPRQSGKGEIIMVVELAALFLLDEDLVMHSAHKFGTAMEQFRRIRGVIDATPDLSRLVKAMYHSNDRVGIELTSGQRLKFMARQTSTGRGFSGQRLVLDEAQILSFDTMAALMPTLAAQPNPQINTFGMAPLGNEPSEYFEALRDRGREGDDPSLAWMEWSAGTTPEVVEALDLADPETWARCNPSMGLGRISEEGIGNAFRSLPAEQFAREYLSAWPTLPPEQGNWEVVTSEEWGACSSQLTDDWMADPVTLSVEVTKDLRWATITAAGDNPCGVAVEVVEHRTDDKDWLVARVVELGGHNPKGVMIDSRSPAAFLIPDLEAAGVTVVEVKSSEYARACMSMVDAVKAGTVTHHHQPVLDEAVGYTKTRKFGDGWAFDRWVSQIVTPFPGAALARWGHLEIEAPPPRSVYEDREPVVL